MAEQSTIIEAAAGKIDDSLGTRQLSQLRQENADLSATLDAMVATARANETLFQRFHRLAIELIRSDGYLECIKVVDRYLRAEFDSDAVTFVLFRDEQVLPDGLIARFTSRDQAELFDSFFRNGKSQCGRATPAQLKYLFDERSLEIRSNALIPLGPSAAHGFMAIGSTDKQRFSAELGTVFLDQLGDLISARIEQCLASA